MFIKHEFCLRTGLSFAKKFHKIGCRKAKNVRWVSIKIISVRISDHCCQPAYNPDRQKKESIVALEYSAKSCKKWQFLMIWYVFKKKSIYKQACYNLFETYLTNAVMYINLPNIIRSKKGIKKTFCFIF